MIFSTTFEHLIIIGEMMNSCFKADA